MMRTPVDEIELLQDTLAGRPASFEPLVERYQSLVCAITYGATGSIDRSEELAQQTFLLAWKNLRQLRDLTKFKAWLCRIARNVIQNWLRSQQHDVTKGAAPLETAAGQSASTAPPEEAAIQAEQRAVVDQALKSIPEAYRTPLILFYREHKSARDVATILEVSENTARQRISRARSLLKDRVAAMVETSLAQSKPGKAFTAAVVASVAGTVLKTGATASAATATAAGISGLGMKIVAIAAGLVVLAGTAIVITRKESPRPTTPSGVTNNAMIADETEPPENPVPGPSDLAATEPEQSAVLAEDTLQRTATAAENTENRASDAGNEMTPFEFVPQGILSGQVTDAQTGAPVRDATIRLSSGSMSVARTDEHGFYHIDKIYRPGSNTVYIDSNDYAGFGLNSDAPILNLSEDQQVVKHFQLERACQVQLWVVDADGAPIEGAEVIPTSLADSREVEINDQGLPRRTDRNGYLLLGGIPAAPTEYLVTAIAKRAVRTTQMDSGAILIETQLTHSPGRAVVRLTDPNTVAQVTIALEEGQTIHGYAEYGDNQPAAGVKIGVQPAWWHCMSSQDFYTTNPDGTFAIDHVASGKHNILMGTTNPEGHIISSRTIAQEDLPPAEDGVLLLQVPGPSPQNSVSIRGRLVFADDADPQEIMISATSPGLPKKGVLMPADLSRSRRTAPFVLEGLLPGQYRLHISGDSIQETILEGIPAPTTDLEVEVHAMEVPPLAGFVCDEQTGEPIGQFEVRLRKLQTLRGLNLVPSDKWIAFGNEEGHFSLETVGPGVYQVQALADGYAPSWSEPINTDENHDVAIMLSVGGTLTGRILNQTGEPIEGAQVIPLSWSSDIRSEGLFANEKGATLTKDGIFALPCLPEGLEAIKVVHPDYAVQIVRGIPIQAGQATTIDDVILTPGGSIEGVVLDEQDRPLANQTLYFCDPATGTSENPAHQWATAVTDAEGRYRVDHLPTQLCYVYRSQLRRGVARRAVTVRAGEVAHLDFGGAFKVSGILDAPGDQWSQRRLVLRSTVPAYFQCFTQTEDSGAFSFSGVVPGTYELAYEDRASTSPWKTVTSVTVADADIALGVLQETEGSAQVAVTPETKVSEAPCPRRLSLKLPLRGTQFHWTFDSQADFLAGRLVMRIHGDLETEEIVVFDGGTFAEGWEAMELPPNPKAGEMYFGFLSSQTYLTAPSDTVEIELTVLKDLPGVGPMQTGILPAGAYTAQGTYSLLTDKYAVPDALKEMPDETLQKVKVAYEFKAFLEDLEPQWPLQITSDDGWLNPEQRERLNRTLQQLENQR